jgi:hypothetical protein
LDYYFFAILFWQPLEIPQLQGWFVDIATLTEMMGTRKSLPLLPAKASKGDSFVLL